MLSTGGEGVVAGVPQILGEEKKKIERRTHRVKI